MKKIVLLLAVVLLCTTGIFAAGRSEGSGDNAVTITLLRPSTSLDGFQQIYPAIEKKLNIKTEVEWRVGGAEGETIIRTRLAAGDMADLFDYNTGSKLNDLNPERNCLDLTPYYGSMLDPQFARVASAGGRVYALPITYTTLAGAFLYNKKIYQQLGLQVPRTWKEFLENCDKIQAAGIVPIIGTYRDTSTSQMVFLQENYYTIKAMPNWPAEYTANRAKYATIPAALRGFEKLAETAKYLNRDYLATSINDGTEMLINGEGAHYAAQTNRLTSIEQTFPDAIDYLGVFAQPGDDPNDQGLTVWMPNGLFIYRNTKKLDAARQWVDYFLTQEAFDLYSSVRKPTGPSMILGHVLPQDSIPGILDCQQYFSSGKYELALEFESPIKGPNLEQICIEVTTGRMTPMEAAIAYDQDVQKQAVLLNIPGW